jgi:enoyl-CoA hydratase/carnithine racemase
MGQNERLGAQRAYQLGLVSEIVPFADLRSRAIDIATTIASAPALAVQATLRAVWMAHENSRRHAIDMVPNYVNLGTSYENIQAGQEVFKAPRADWDVR